jgi:hypothetical protein
MSGQETGSRAVGLPAAELPDGGRGGRMVTRTLQLPRLVAGRDFAADMAQSFGDVSGGDVIVDGSRLLSGTPSFAAELVRRLLVDGKAHSLLLVGVPADFANYATTAAHDLGVTDRFDLAEQLPHAS